MNAVKKKYRALPVVIYTLLIFPLLLTLETACSQEPEPPDIAEILSRIDVAAISIDVMDKALPRLSDDAIILRVRGGDPLVLREPDPETENDLKKCFVISAYLTNAVWEWSQYRGTKRTEREYTQIKFPMENYLVNINHRLERIGAPQNLLQEIKQLQAKFTPGGGDHVKPAFEEIAQFLDALSKEVRAFMLTEAKYDLTFTMAEWLVWQAQLSNLCLAQKEENAPYLREVMNQRYRTVSLTRFADLSSDIFGADTPEQFRKIKKSLEKLQKIFLLDSQKEVKRVQDEVKQIFDIFDLKFPSLKVY